MKLKLITEETVMVATNVIEKIRESKSDSCMKACPKSSCPCTSAIDKYKKGHDLTSQEYDEIEEYIETR